MHTNTSVFLDITRLLAALVVFLGHAAGVNWTGGLFWQLSIYMDACVMVFFVLSGFVIAHVTEDREGNWTQYTANRIARLYSVGIPALALTFFVDWFGVRIAPELYIDQPWYHGDALPLRYLASALMVHEYWKLGLVPGINGPFWSLSYEATYYLWFGIALFGKGKWKWVALIGLSLLAGPLILSMFPAWLLGVLAYRWSRQNNLSNRNAWLAILAGAATIGSAPFIGDSLMPVVTVMETPLGARILASTGFFIVLIGVVSIAPTLPTARDSFAKWVAWCAAPTFALYLFHRPLIQLFSYLGPEDSGSLGRRLLVIGGTLVAIYWVSPYCDAAKIRMRRGLLRLFNRHLPAHQSGR